MAQEICKKVWNFENNLPYFNSNHLIYIKPYKWNYILWCNYCGLGKLYKVIEKAVT